MRWPRWLRGKWLAVGLLALFFWAYEAFGLWASPWWTACIAVAYFLAAFAIDAWFQGAAFCKYVCPIGQFNFVQSLMSPTEVRVRDPHQCQSCATKDCLRGGPSSPGCELHLYLPRKAGNLDCTFCLDCIHACPHDNIGILAVPPGTALWHDPPRSGIGRLSRRPDLAVLVVLLTFAAFANAAGMVAPVVDAQDRMAATLGLASPFWIVTASLIVALLVLPVLLVGAAAALSRWWSGDRGRWTEATTRFAYLPLPLGCGMWLAHYSFHLLTSAGTVIPVTQRAAADLGFSFLGTSGVGLRLLRGRRAVDRALGNPFSRSRFAAVALHRLSNIDGVPSSIAVGDASPCAVGHLAIVVIRRGDVDCVAANGNARRMPPGG